MNTVLKPESERPRAPEWAIVAGASTGEGEQSARRLAAGGLNLILMASTPERLRLLADELTYEHGVAVKTLPVDPADPNAGPMVEAATWGLDVSHCVSKNGCGAVRQSCP